MEKKFKILYGILAVFILSITTVGVTYAYWVASASSLSRAVQTNSTIYNISMGVSPLYNGFSFIPMNDADVLKALENQCKDKYDRGACSAYSILVNGYDEELDYISGFMDITTNNMTNLSYMVLERSETDEGDSCILIGEEYYCVTKEATSIGNGEKLSLGEAYDVSSVSEVKFILVIWLTNLGFSQNDIDIGDFNATITFQTGIGGEIKGSIASTIQIMDGEGSEE